MLLGFGELGGVEQIDAQEPSTNRQFFLWNITGVSFECQFHNN